MAIMSAGPRHFANILLDVSSFCKMRHFSPTTKCLSRARLLYVCTYLFCSRWEMQSANSDATCNLSLKSERYLSALTFKSIGRLRSPDQVSASIANGPFDK